MEVVLGFGAFGFGFSFWVSILGFGEPKSRGLFLGDVEGLE